MPKRLIERDPNRDTEQQDSRCNHSPRRLGKSRLFHFRFFFTGRKPIRLRLAHAEKHVDAGAQHRSSIDCRRRPHEHGDSEQPVFFECRVVQDLRRADCKRRRARKRDPSQQIERCNDRRLFAAAPSRPRRVFETGSETCRRNKQHRFDEPVTEYEQSGSGNARFAEQAHCRDEHAGMAHGRECQQPLEMPLRERHERANQRCRCADTDEEGF